MAFRTQLTERLGIKHPIVCGGMHHVGYPEMAAAVSNAGGLGVLTALSQPNPEALRDAIRKTKTLTKNPFGVNVTLLPALTPPNYDAYVDVIIAEGIKVVETAGRDPGKYIKRFKEAGVCVIHKCVSVRHGLTAQRMGADFVAIDGFECAGHPGEEDVGLWTLMALAARKLTIPFLASGGCGTGRHLAAALAFGASGMVMGTRFMATTECTIKETVKQALVDGDERSTTLVMRSLKNTERVYDNPVARKVQEIEKEKPGDIQAILPYVRGELYRKTFHETGDVKTSIFSAGQVMGVIDKVESCSDVIEGIVKEAVDSLNATRTLVVPAKL